MQINLNSFLKNVDKSYLKHPVNLSDFTSFLSEIKDKTDSLERAQTEGEGRESEEHLKNIFNTILNNSIYKKNLLNTKNRIDCAIIDEKHNVATILEFKTPRNTNEMISVQTLHKKALFESIYYLYTERLNGNVNIKNIIISDTTQFFIFDTKQFIDSKIEKLCRDFNDGKTNLTGTGDIYNQIAILIKDKDYDFAYFDFSKSINVLKKMDLENIDRDNTQIKDLIKFYKILHPDFMLGQYRAGDANQLNQKFYSELLYILGLEEAKEKSKTVITLSKTNNTFMSEVLEKLEEEKAIYDKDKRFDSGLDLVINWLNRVLFLKLFEGQLMSFNKSKDFAFLSYDKLNDFDGLNTLFFAVLGKPINDRRQEDKNTNIPYLNSSLFEISDSERDCFLVSSLRNDLTVDLYKNSVLKKNKDYKNVTKVNLLKYLLDFLDSFDFASENTDDELQEDSKDIINSAVLGLIFEKLNGYKDGSYFTPSTITEYMASETLNRSVVQKFNKEFGIDCSGIDELKNWLSDKCYKTENLQKYNDIINSLKICDPAVGSGHFLVSVLNHMIYLKSYLGILWNGKNRVNEQQIDVVNDSLLVTSSNDGSVVKYKRNNQSTHNIQQTIFNEKRTIIEDCLFAVDINPKSVQICRLRLWIELLKNTYYIGNSNDMQILPNIDINVKCGNSLISKYKPVVGKSISDSYDVDGRTQFGKQIAEYRKLVSEYKSADRKEIKIKINSALNDIKGKIKQAKQLNLELDAFDKKSNKAVFESDVYNNSIEWMIEFPEVLDADGNFMGFDIVIGNPPYIDSEAMINNGQGWFREYLVKNYETARGNFDIYITFFDLGFIMLSNNGVLSYISPDKWLNKTFGKALRANLLDNIYAITKTGDVFDSARVDSIVTFVAKDVSYNITSYVQNGTEFNKFTEVSKVLLKTPYQLDFIFSTGLNIINKLDKAGNKLFSISVCESSCSTSDAYLLTSILNDAQNPNYNNYKIANTGTLSKYAFRWGIKAMRYIKKDYMFPVVDRFVFGQTFKNTYLQKTNSPKIIIKGMTLLDAALDVAGDFVAGKSTLVICNSDINKLKFLLAIVNSKISIYYISQMYPASSYNGGISFNKDMINNIPVPNLSFEQQQPIIDLVDRILIEKQKDPIADTSGLESEIDQLVYNLYNLTPEEISIVEGK